MIRNSLQLVSSNSTLFSTKFFNRNTKKFYRNVYKTQVQPTTIISTKDVLNNFSSTYENFVKELKGVQAPIPYVQELFDRLFKHNLPYGKKKRGTAFVLAYEHFTQENANRRISHELLYTIAWCIEVCQASILVTDDILDDSKVRRGQPCWHLLLPNSSHAVNDVILLAHSVFPLLKKRLGTEPYYNMVVEMINETQLRTAVGQYMDSMLPVKDGKPYFDLFTMDTFTVLSHYKTGYSIQLPVSTAMHIAGVHDPHLHHQISEIVLKLGVFYQIQNDFNDCFSNAALTGKEGNDIQEAKCSWLVVTALERANAEQRETIERCYGSKRAEDVKAVKQVYNDLKLPEVYLDFTERSFNALGEQIREVPNVGHHELLFSLQNLIYKRA